MATYQAPGVYVEEVPSAQQPIAGVGTNTVGFIGIVPDLINYPVSNDIYDPTIGERVAKEMAEKVAKVKSLERDLAKAHESKEAQEKVDKLKSEKVAAEQDRDAFKAEGGEVTDLLLQQESVQKSFDEAVEKLKGELSEAEKRKYDKQRRDSERDLTTLKGNVDDARKRADDLKTQDQRVRDLAQELATAEAELQSLKDKLEEGTLSEDERKGLIEDQTKERDNIAKLSGQIDEANERFEKLQQESKDRTIPYRLENFIVKAEPGGTRLCTNFSEYRAIFGPFSADNPDKPGEAMYPGHRALTHAVYGFFQNGGTRCFVTRVKNPADIRRTMENFESIDALAIVAAPGQSDPDVYDALTSHCETCQDRFAILDSREEVGDGGILDLKLLNYDNLNNVLPQCNRNAAFYFPWIEVVDPAKQLQDQDPARGVELKYRGRIHVAPSGHVAGIYARTDEQRGVHKAPANAPVLGALNVKYYIGKPKQVLLNPQGVNVIRNINGNITVWGARTIGGDKNTEWKYVNVRRVFLFLRESIDEGTQWVVFEPNDRALWGKIRRNVSDFLRNVWRSGALFGSTPEEAFYVKCDDETNPPEVRELGQVITEIGVAIVRPAEFVIFRVTQSTGARK